MAQVGPDRGTASVYVNGVKVSTVNLRASTAQALRVAWKASWTSSASRTVKIVVDGTAGHPRVDLDALVTVQ